MNARILSFFWLTASPQSARSQTPFRICYDPRTLTIPHMSPYVSPPPPEPQVFWQSAIPSEAPFNSRFPRFQHQINGQIIFSRWNRPLRIPPTLIPPRSLPQIRASYNARSVWPHPFFSRQVTDLLCHRRRCGFPQLVFRCWAPSYIFWVRDFSPADRTQSKGWIIVIVAFGFCRFDRSHSLLLSSSTTRVLDMAWLIDDALAKVVCYPYVSWLLVLSILE